jgi:hypothetical protein
MASLLTLPGGAFPLLPTYFALALVLFVLPQFRGVDEIVTPISRIVGRRDGALHLYLRRNAVTEITDSGASFWERYQQRGR